MHLNNVLTIPYHAGEDTKCMSTCVGQTHLMPEKPQNVSQLVLIKLIPCQ